jgi:hypothetical protein
MKQNIKPKLISNRIYRKMFKKNLKIKSTNDKNLIIVKDFLKSNWYILLISSFLLFILYLKYKENKKIKEKFDFEEKNKQNIEESLDKATEANISDYQIVQRNGPKLSNNIPEYIF